MEFMEKVIIGCIVFFTVCIGMCFMCLGAAVIIDSLNKVGLI